MLEVIGSKHITLTLVKVTVAGVLVFVFLWLIEVNWLGLYYRHAIDDAIETIGTIEEFNRVYPGSKNFIEHFNGAIKPTVWHSIAVVDDR